MIIIGIDPGKKGGVAIYDAYAAQVYRAFKMPLAGSDIDLASLARSMWFPARTVRVYVEKVWAMKAEGRTQGAQSSFVFGLGTGGIHGVIMAHSIHGDYSLELVTPQRWKGAVLSGTKKDKDAAIAYCRRAWPGTSLIPPRGRVPSDGIADALCIMEYGRRFWI